MSHFSQKHEMARLIAMYGLSASELAMVYREELRAEHAPQLAAEGMLSGMAAAQDATERR